MLCLIVHTLWLYSLVFSVDYIIVQLSLIFCHQLPWALLTTFSVTSVSLSDIIESLKQRTVNKWTCSQHNPQIVLTRGVKNWLGIGHLIVRDT